jgi:glycosyltransferase involved in cell wall biosynthesis
MTTAGPDEAGVSRADDPLRAGIRGKELGDAADSDRRVTPGARSVLFVAFFFPPLGGGGVQRSLKFVRYLPDHGWQPRVLAAEADYWMRDEALLAEVPPGTPVLRVAFGGRRLIAMGGRGGIRSRAATRFLRGLSRFFLVPDAYVGWSRRAARVAEEEITRHPCALLYTTSSPDSAHLLGRRVKRATGLPWVADFRDPWTGRLAYAPPTPLHHRSHLALERSCLREADAVVVTTPETRDDFLARHGGLDPAKFRVIANGFDEDDFAAATAERTADAGTWIPAGGFPVLHAGQLNLDRPLAPFLSGLRLYRERALRGESAGPAGHAVEGVARSAVPPGNAAGATAEGAAEGIPRSADTASGAQSGEREAMTFLLGPCYDSHREEVKAAGLAGVVRFLPGRTHHDAVAAMLSARVLLLLEQDSDRGRLVLPGKAFEYLRAGRPILAVVPRGGAAARFVRETGAGIAVDPSNPAEIAEALARLLGGGAEPSPSVVSAARYERRVLTAELARLFDGVLAAQPTRG